MPLGLLEASASGYGSRCKFDYQIGVYICVSFNERLVLKDRAFLKEMSLEI